MTSLPDACDDLRQWLPAAAELLAEPDTDGTSGGGKPGSSPPWNPAAAGAYFGAHATIRDTEQLLRYVVTGASAEPRPWSEVHTAAALTAIERLAAAAPYDHVQRAAGALMTAVTAILQLAAIDEAERFIRLTDARCPYCGPKGFTGSLRASLRTGRIACIRYGACKDSDGNTPTGLMGRSQLDGTPRITWQDGLVT